MLVISVVGVSKSGKTTTIEYLASRLTEEGYRVGSIKHIHHADFTIDTEGTDTWRHMKAGSRVTVAFAPKEITIIKKVESTPADLDNILKLLEKEGLDIVFIEGLHSLTAKRWDIPKIVTAKEPDDLVRTLNGTEPVLAITGVIASKRTDIGNINVPVININEEGEKLLKIIKDRIRASPGGAIERRKEGA